MGRLVEATRESQPWWDASQGELSAQNGRPVSPESVAREPQRLYDVPRPI